MSFLVTTTHIDVKPNTRLCAKFRRRTTRRLGLEEIGHRENKQTFNYLVDTHTTKHRVKRKS